MSNDITSPGINGPVDVRTLVKAKSKTQFTARISAVQSVSQRLASLTYTVYTPSIRLLNAFPGWKTTLSKLYSNGAVPPTGLTVKLPSIPVEQSRSTTARSQTSGRGSAIV